VVSTTEVVGVTLILGSDAAGASWVSVVQAAIKNVSISDAGNFKSLDLFWPGMAAL
jgi:hypothetical protein